MMRWWRSHSVRMRLTLLHVAASAVVLCFYAFVIYTVVSSRASQALDVQVDRDFQSEIRLDVTNQRGALATIAAAIAEQSANIENVQMTDRDDRYVSMTFIITVRDRVHLARVLRAIRAIKHVTRVQRTRS